MARATPNIALLYSGGAGNTNPSLSIGGAASQAAGKYIHSQTTSPSPIPGVEITHAAANPAGSGNLSYTVSNSSFTWENPLGVTQTLIYTDQERLALGFVESGWVRLLITPESLPLVDTGGAVTVSDAMSTLFSAPSANEITNGLTDYRCLYLWNQSDATLTDVTLVLTDNAPESALAVGSTYNSPSRYRSPAAEGLDFRLLHAFAGVAPYTVSMSGRFQRERLLARTPIGTPAFSYYPVDYVQDSDGVSRDLDVLLSNSLDPTNKLAGVDWGATLYWGRILPGRMVSFWVRRVMPPNPTLPTFEQALFDITFTVS